MSSLSLTPLLVGKLCVPRHWNDFTSAGAELNRCHLGPTKVEDLRDAPANIKFEQEEENKQTA